LRVPFLFAAPRFRGTLAPDFLASESPIATACFRLVTFRPALVFKLPRFFSCIAFATFRDAAVCFFAISTFLLRA
jgi:hypothetical protein